MLVNPTVDAWCYPKPRMHGIKSHRSDDVSCLGHLAGTATVGAAGEESKEENSSQARRG